MVAPEGEDFYGLKACAIGESIHMHDVLTGSLSLHMVVDGIMAFALAFGTLIMADRSLDLTASFV